jgi:glycine hydroxymethyltransferase
MLLKVVPAEGAEGGTTLKNMHVPHFPEMALFQTELLLPGSGSSSDDSQGRVRVTFKGGERGEKSLSTPTPNGRVTRSLSANGHGGKAEPGLGGTTLDIPLTPDTRGLEELAVMMHKSPTKGYNMGARCNAWFSERFGYDVVLAYLSEENWRGVLGTFPPAKHFAHKAYLGSSPWATATATATVRDPWIVIAGFVLVAVLAVVLELRSGLTVFANKTVQLVSGALIMGGYLGWFYIRGEQLKNERITFADAAPYMVVSETSVANVSERLEGEEMDVRKFRANVVVEGAETAFEEDFWAELVVGKSEDKKSGVRLLLTANCVRCRSLDVDYATGKMGEGESGKVLKKLMADRRVDSGAKYSPVFGRYGFLDARSDSKTVRVGDEVVVARRMQERSVYGEFPGSFLTLSTVFQKTENGLTAVSVDWPGLA